MVADKQLLMITSTFQRLHLLTQQVAQLAELHMELLQVLDL